MQNLLDPAVLFFVFGVLAGTLRSNLEIPAPISRFLSLYLLMALGLKGGFALAESGLGPAVLASLAAALAMAAVVPALGYWFLKRHVGRFDAAAIAAAYGSVSAVTFVAATQYLESVQLAAGGHMAVALVLMESPAILMAVLLANMIRGEAASATQAVSLRGGAAALGALPPGGGTRLGKILHEAFTDGAQLLLLGAMVVGFVSGEAGKAVMAPFASQLFKGMLAFFLLDMGLMVARNAGGLRGKSPALIAYALLAPPAHAGVALALCVVLRIPAGDAALLMVLSASASYIVVPAVLRYAIPEANPSLYFGLPLGITFPLNILVGIPLYTEVARRVFMPV